MKKFLCYALSLVLLLSAFSLCVFAEEESYGYSADRVQAVELSAVADIKTLASSDPSGFSADGYAAGTEWKITDAAGLQLFSKISNHSASYNFFEKTVYLAADIDMSGVTDFKPIGNDTRVSGSGVLDGTVFFRGTFDGQGHTVSNLVMSSSDTGNVCVALFGAVRGAVIRNLVIDSSCSFTYTGNSPDARVASVAAFAFSHGGDTHVGAAEGSDGVYVTYRIENVKNQAAVKTSAGYAGGIVGIVGGATGNIPFVTGCTNTGRVEGRIAAGGIVGCQMARKLWVENCLNSGDVTARTYASGILNSTVPDTNPTEIKHCKVSGTITGGSIDKIAYISGKAVVSITDCDDSGATLVKKETEVYLGYTDEAVAYEGTVGYSSARVETVDLSNVLPVCTFLEADDNVTEFKISTPNDLRVFSELVNSGATMPGYTVYLENDIDMTGVTMRPIGSSGSGIFTDKNSVNYFAGTFDGQGHVIDNLVMEYDWGTGAAGEFCVVALFGVIRSAVIRNVVVGSGCRFTYTGPAEGYVAGLVGMIYRLPVSTESYSVIDNCYSAAAVTGPKSTGGIAGIVEGNNNNYSHILKNCTNTGAVTADIYAGGIVAYINNRRINIENCRNTGTVTLRAQEAADTKGAAGICARPNSSVGVNIKGCINNGAINGPGTLGGIVAIENNTSVKIDTCTNFGTLTASTADRNVGPIYGLLQTSVCDHMTGNCNATGKTDTTLSQVEQITTSFPDYAEIDAAHEALFGGEEDEPGTGPSVTTGGDNKPPKPEQPTGTDPQDTGSAEPGSTGDANGTEPQKGCASAIAGGALTLLFTVCMAGALLKKRAH